MLVNVSFRHTAVLVLSALVGCGAAFGAATASAQAPYEPNDSPQTAKPLVAGTPSAAAIDTPNDKDLFVFYIARRETQVAVDVANTTPVTNGALFLGGGFYDAKLKQLVSLDEPFGLSEGETKRMAYTFGPGKYYLLLQDGYLGKPGVKSYTFTATGELADPATLRARCTRAKSANRAASKRHARARKALTSARRRGSGVARAKRRLRAAQKRHRATARTVRATCIAG